MKIAVVTLAFWCLAGPGWSKPEQARPAGAQGKLRSRGPLARPPRPNGAARYRRGGYYYYYGPNSIYRSPGAARSSPPARRDGDELPSYKKSSPAQTLPGY